MTYECKECGSEEITAFNYKNKVIDIEDAEKDDTAICADCHNKGEVREFLK